MPAPGYLNNPANRNLTTAQIAERMHDDSVDLWNAAHDEGISVEDIEKVQRILSRLAWPVA